MRRRLIRPVAWLSSTVALLMATGFHFLIVTPDRSASATAIATCAADVGRGGATGATNVATRGGDGCVVIDVNGLLTTFVFTGAAQTWAVPAGVDSVRLHLVGAGGGGGRSGTTAFGGGGGYVTGTLAVSAGQTFDIIVGQGGVRQCIADVPALNDVDGRRNFSFGGGASGNGAAAYDCTFASGGGRSAVRMAGATDDLATAGGGGGGGYSTAGGAGGGLAGSAGGGAVGGGGGTQSTGGTTATPEPGVAGVRYAGGWAGYSASTRNAASEGGGGGGGYYGGGGGGDNGGGGGGSSFLGTLTSASTTAGSGRQPGIDVPVSVSAPTIATDGVIGANLASSPGTWSFGGTSSFRWQSSTDNVSFVDVDGATGATFMPTVPGFLRVVEKRSNFLGTTEAISNVVSVADTTLASIALSAGTLSPAFSSVSRSYSVAVKFAIRSLRVTPLASSNSATLKVNGLTVDTATPYRDIDLEVGDNVVTIDVHVGSSTTPTNLTITRAGPTVPGSPSIADVSAGDGDITVKFSPPVDNGGVVVERYEYSLDGVTWQTANVVDDRFVVSGLKNDDECTVSLRAVNAVGAGVAARGKAVTPRAAPTTTESTLVPSSVTTLLMSTTTVRQKVSTGRRPPVSTGPERALDSSTTVGSTTIDTALQSVAPTTTEIPDVQVNDTTTSTSLVANAPTSTTAPAVTELPTTRLVLVPRMKPGQVAAGSDVVVEARGLKPGTVVVLELHSVVRRLGEKEVAIDGAAEIVAAMPDDVESGAHALVVRGIAPDGSVAMALAPLSIGSDGRIEKILPSTSRLVAVPTPEALARMLAEETTPYDPEADFAGVAALATAAVVLMGVAGGRSRSDSRTDGDGEASEGETDGIDSEETTDNAEQRDESSESSLSSAEAKILDVDLRDSDAWGDNSRLWRLPGWPVVHKTLHRLARLVENKSLLLVRFVQDGSAFRAAFGTLGVVPWAVGVALGAGAAHSVSGESLPPPFAWVLAIVLIAFVDALAGALAWLSFVVVVAASGHATSWLELRTALGIGVLFACLPIMAAAIRPISRSVVNERSEVVQRIGDYFMMPIFIAYAAASVYTALNGLSGLVIVASSSADSLRNIVFGAAILRLAFEDTVARGFPHRHGETFIRPERLPGNVVAHLNLVVLWGTFLLTAGPFFGLGWRTWVVVTLMTVVPFVKIHRDRLPNSAIVHKWFPRGILRAVILIFVGAYYGRWIQDLAGNPTDARALAPVLLLPGVAIGLVDCLARKGGTWRDSAAKQTAGFALWVVTLAVLLGWITP